MSVNRGGLYASPRSLLGTVIGPDETHLHYSVDHSQDFLDAIKTRTDPASPIHGAVNCDVISHMCDVSLRTGRKITWDPKKETIVGDAHANALLTRPMREPWHL